MDKTKQIIETITLAADAVTQYTERGGMGSLNLLVAHLETALDQVRSQMQIELSEMRQSETRQRDQAGKARRRFFKIADNFGLDTQNHEAIREAFSKLLGRTVHTRKTLTEREWDRGANAIEEGWMDWERRDAGQQRKAA